MLSLAPFQGITDVVYRNVFKKHFRGIDKYYTPFFTGIQKDNSKSLRGEEISPEFNDVNTIVPQILSNTAEEIVRFANQCKSMGYPEFNLNMGCPFPRVANKTRGCGLMADPDRTIKMLNEVFEHIDGIKFSIKCRLGYYSDEEIYAFVDTFNTLNFSEIIIHPRIGKQMYTGEASLEKFNALVPLINKPLVYNGDIFTTDRYNSILSSLSSLSSFSILSFDIMLGRGLLTDPFLAEEIKNIDNQQDKKQRLHNFVVDLYVARLHHAGGSPKIIGSMKELWKYMMNIFDDPQNVWRKVKKVNHLDEYEDSVEKIFNEHNLII
ncbi:MAG: tRNA-dihydrouridine synthase family protein [Bacteroidales bacterium]|nr:tRNA-dihydrouridine synthase family protein [Bacteroidales bacterium]